MHGAKGSGVRLKSLGCDHPGSQVQLYEVVNKGSGHPGISLQLPLPHLAVSQIVWPPPAATSAHASPARTIAATAAGTLTGTGTIISPGPRGALRPVLVVYPAGLSKRCWLLAAETLARTQRFREPAGG